MATYNQIGYGSKGSDVTELQKLLNQNGYTLDTDGIYGSKTLAAVKDYQQKNGLAVDGIVGNNTWGALTKANTSDTAGGTSPEETAPEIDPSLYTPSDTVTQAETLLNQHLANKPGEYQSTWQDQLNDLYDRISNREDFSYDLNGDLLYQQIKDQYDTQGNMAMMDTMGQAAALTGGYGNSYAQSVGQQTYQGYLQKLNDRIPELYQLALSQYNAEGDEMYNQFALMSGLEEQEYGRHRDSVNDFYTELSRLTDAYNTERDYDYSQWYNNLMYQYQTGRDEVADQQWQAQFDEAKRQFDLQYSKSSSGGGGGYYGGGAYESIESIYPAPEGWTKEEIMKFQSANGLTADGVWGQETQKAAYNSVVNDVNYYIKKGESKSTISTFLREKLNEGFITKEQHSKLVEQYVPRGVTY